MRVFLAAVALIAISIGQASAACTCQCVASQVQSVCTAPTDVPATCTPAACTNAPPAGFPPQDVSVTGATPPPDGPPQTSALRPPSTAVAPAAAPVPARALGADGNPPRSTTGLGPAGIIPPSITFSPATAAPGPQSLCFQQRVFNINTQQYEWQQLCD
jgi:hypothetical protein